MEDCFDFVNHGPEWRRDNFADFERVQALGNRLWGQGQIENLQRQLELPSPEIPPGVGKQELLALKQHARMMMRAANHRWMPRLAAPVITVGADRFSIAEAMYEIVRRAIAALGN
jgi:hypothetical protein